MPATCPDRTRTRRAARREKGIALILTSMGMMFLTLFLGLAVDATQLIVIRSRLSAAVDAAALGAGRSLNLGSSVSEANSFAAQAGQSFFLANFPQNYMGTATMNVATDVTSVFSQQTDTKSGLPNGIVSVTVRAKVTAPVYFMRLTGITGVPISSTGSATRRGLAMMLVLDISGSMNNSYNGSTACTVMIAAASNFVQNFSPYDSLGLIAFDGTAHLAYPPSPNWKTGNAMQNAINGLGCNGSTNTTAALNLAYSQLTGGISLPLALNSIVLFTDGMPNAISAAYPIRNQADTRYGFGGGPAGCTKTNVLCSMPVCTTATGTVSGVVSQSSGYAPTGNMAGLGRDFDSDPSPSGIPAGCPKSGSGLRQTLGGLPALDRFGNSTSGFKDNWVYPVNWQCNPAGACANLGDFFSPNFTATASGSNWFTSGPYSGYGRLDQPTSIGAFGMNTATAQAKKIRGDKAYNIVIHSIYLLGNGSDPVDKTFLPIVSNESLIPALPVYEATGTPAISNPYYDSTEQSGLFFAASDKAQLNGLFAQVASSLLRLSQ